MKVLIIRLHKNIIGKNSVSAGNNNFRRLNSFGVEYSIIEILDMCNLEKTLEFAAECFDIVLFSRYTDMFEEVNRFICEITDDVTEHSEKLKEYASEFFARNGLVLAPDFDKFCIIPSGANVVANDFGMPSFTLSYYGSTLFFPMDILEDDVLFEYIRRNNNENCYIYKLFGMDAHEVKEVVAKLNIYDESIVSFHAFGENLDVTLSAVFPARTNPASVDEVIIKIEKVFEKNIYADYSTSLEECAFEALITKRKKIAVAESLTGGLIADSLIRFSGASDFLVEDLVTYADSSKKARLGVREQTLKNYGAVSGECAFEMCAGLLADKGCSIAVSTTGIAGPTGASEEKPVGLVYIGLGDQNEVHVYANEFKGDRTTVRETAKNAALFYLIKLLRDNEFPE